MENIEPEKKSNGALIGSIVVIVILIIGGIYIWQTKVRDTLNKESQMESTATEKDSSELNNLEKDINATNIEIEASVINSLE